MEFTVWAPHAHKVEVFTSKDRFTCIYPLERIDEILIDVREDQVLLL